MPYYHKGEPNIMHKSEYAPKSLTQECCQRMGLNENDRHLEAVEFSGCHATLKPDGTVKRVWLCHMHYYNPKFDDRSSYSAEMTQEQFNHFFGKTQPQDFVLPKAEPKQKGEK